MSVLYADVEYHGLIYHDAELRQNTWFFRNGEGCHAFLEQETVIPQNVPKLDRRHSGSALRRRIVTVQEFRRAAYKAGGYSRNRVYFTFEYRWLGQRVSYGDFSTERFSTARPKSTRKRLFIDRG
jgi:hypothetical protein